MHDANGICLSQEAAQECFQLSFTSRQASINTAIDQGHPHRLSSGLNYASAKGGFWRPQSYEVEMLVAGVYGLVRWYHEYKVGRLLVGVPIPKLYGHQNARFHMLK